MRLRECAETVKQVQVKIDFETFLTKSNKYSIVEDGDSISQHRKCEYTNEAQTLVVWAFSKFAIILRTTICEKSIDTLWWNGDRIFYKVDCAVFTKMFRD